jgi:hypothetical protein
MPNPAKKGGPTMMARIGVMQALNRKVERVFNPDRKDTHWRKAEPATYPQFKTAESWSYLPAI